MKRLLTALCFIGLFFGYGSAQIGKPVDDLIAKLENHRIIKTVLGYATTTDFSISFDERNGAVFKVTGEGDLTEENIELAGDLIGAASGYDDGIGEPVKEFLRTRIGELAGQGEVDLAVEQYILSMDVTGEAAPYTANMTLSLAQTPLELFPAAKHSLGPADAKYVIREFSDFQCPFCARFVAGPLEMIKADLLSRGDVRFEFHHFPLVSIHPNAFPAAEASECVTAANTPEAFWLYHDALFARQQAWQALPDPSEYFVRLAEDIGLSSEGVAQCIADRNFAIEVDEAYNTAGDVLRISGTPTVFVNGYRVANFNDPNSYLSLIELIDTFDEN